VARAGTSPGRGRHIPGGLRSPLQTFEPQLECPPRALVLPSELIQIATGLDGLEQPVLLVSAPRCERLRLATGTRSLHGLAPVVLVAVAGLALRPSGWFVLGRFRQRGSRRSGARASPVSGTVSDLASGAHHLGGRGPFLLDTQHTPQALQEAGELLTVGDSSVRTTRSDHHRRAQLVLITIVALLADHQASSLGLRREDERSRIGTDPDLAALRDLDHVRPPSRRETA
jgi:hypothetical protein